MAAVEDVEVPSGLPNAAVTVAVTLAERPVTSTVRVVVVDFGPTAEPDQVRLNGPDAGGRGAVAVDRDRVGRAGVRVEGDGREVPAAARLVVAGDLGQAGERRAGVDVRAMVSRPATVEPVDRVAGPEAGAVHEYQSDALPAPALVAVGVGSPVSAEDSRLSPATVPLTPLSVVR